MSNQFTIRLEGYMKRFHPEVITLMATTPREALSLLQNYLPKGVRHLVRIAELPCEAAFDNSNPNEKTLTITPIIMGAGGSKKGAGFQIAIGILLIALAVTGVGLGASGFFTKIGISKGALILTGAQLMLGGALQLLQKTPKADPTQGDMKSRFINGKGNTIEEGTPIPLIYGLQVVKSLVHLSSRMTTSFHATALSCCWVWVREKSSAWKTVKRVSLSETFP